MLSAALSATACAIALGIPLERCAERLGSVRPSPGRMEEFVGANGIRLLHDAYNANPVSVAAALRALVAARGPGRAIAVLGPMAQLGAASRLEHERLGRLVSSLGIDALVAVGPEGRWIADAAVRAGMDAAAVRWCEDREEALSTVLDRTVAGDAVLVKASNAAGLGELAEALARGAPPGQWQEPVPASVNVRPCSGTNRQS